METDVAEADEIKLHHHASNGSIRQVGAVHQRDTVHETTGNDQAFVDPSNDSALFIWRELRVNVIVP
jgi:hypothetical protein